MHLMGGATTKTHDAHVILVDGEYGNSLPYFHGVWD